MPKFIPKPVNVNEIDADGPLILASPFVSSLLFQNDASDARDHCANERNFLSWLRLSIYLCVVSVAIVISFHFKREPSQLERNMSLPLGLIFWALSLTCLFAGLANYLKTIQLYSKKRALVQSGAKTQLTLGIITVAIIATCLLFLSTNAHAGSGEEKN